MIRNRRRLTAYRFLKSIKQPKVLTIDLSALPQDFNIEMLIEAFKKQPLIISQNKMDTKAVYKMNIAFRRGGNLEGVFVAEKAMVEMLIESELEVYFGEVMGKHSEIYGSIRKEDITMLTDSDEAVEIIEKYNLSNGHNPFNYSAINTGEEYEDWNVEDIIRDMLEKE